jgi:hypothetical protein
VYSDQPAYGRITCHDYQADCYLALPTLRIHDTPLLDLAGTRRWPRKIEFAIEYCKSWLRVHLPQFRDYIGT